MANNISKFTSYVSVLDEVYKEAAKSSVLESDSELFREGANAHEIVIPKMSLSGLADYDRANGYVDGDVTLTNETVEFNYERGRMFSVDAMDDEETAGVAFGKLAGEFIRTKVVPEVDAVRFASYASNPSAKTVSEALTDGDSVLASIRTAKASLDESEVSEDGRYLFITPTLFDKIEALDTTKSKEILNSFAGVITVPQSRFYTAVKLIGGTAEGENGGGYEKDAGAADINFMIIQKDAVLQYTKHAEPKVINPSENQTADAYKFGYRIYGINDVYENKAGGIYVSTKSGE